MKRALGILVTVGVFGCVGSLACSKSTSALTPGGRFDMDTAGVRELALALAEGGKQVLLWDRPNTGGSRTARLASTSAGRNTRDFAPSAASSSAR